MIRIGIDARAVTTESRGLRTYAYNLIRELASKDRNVMVTLYTHDPSLQDVVKQSYYCAIKMIPNWIPLKTHLWLPIQARGDNIQVMAFLANYTWLIQGCPTAATVHDMTTELFPEIFYPGFTQKIFYQMRKKLLARMDLLVTVSESSRRDIIKYIDIHEQKTAVIYNGVSDVYQSQALESDSDTLKKYFLEGRPYILYVGALDFRKNLENLLKAFALVKKSSGIVHNLVLAGGSDPSRPDLYPDLSSLAVQYGIENSIRFLGYVEDCDLPVIYRYAELFVFPSLYEGFGLPPLEAMASGVPVVCSDAASLPEVIGDAGVLVNARVPESIAEAILRILSDKNIASDLRQRGLERARQFTWEAAADKWVNSLKSLSERI
jgi:glycosyltransferase involved in cell wall biosynthesis